MRYPLTIRPVRNVLIACLFFLVSITTTGLAQSPAVEIKKNEVELHFPSSIEFSLSAHSQKGIKEVALLYGVESESCLNAQARQDLRVVALPEAIHVPLDRPLVLRHVRAPCSRPCQRAGAPAGA